MSIIAPSPSGRNGPRGMREIECEHYNYISLCDQRELMGKKTAHTKPIAELKIFNSTRTMELVMKGRRRATRQTERFCVSACQSVSARGYLSQTSVRANRRSCR